ncbi:MAG TPA: Smr/MutS family protein [Candidatus Cryptobacteroides intestinipullorum]|mgnify:CR=1 FL=1|nr:Smr/MutS family protein [Candidatus Cryptobacteroides intestinipullorum]
MEETLIDTRLEQKLGFDRIRKAVADKCVTEYAVNRAMEETFVADGKVIRDRLLLTDEMRLILMFEENFPTSGYIDCLGFLKLLETPSSYINLLSLRKLRTMLETVRKVTGFFSSIRDGIYPCLKKMAEPVMCFPEVQRQIDLILDKFGEVRDTASPELASIRKTLRDTEGTISRRVNAILKKIQEDGIADKDASVSVRDGKLLIPVPAVNKKKVQGFIYDESSSGKTAFIEPAEIVELDNRIKELRFAENREILRILTVFTDFLRPYVPDLLDSAEFLGEMDFIMAKAGLALDMISGMPVLSSTGEMSVRKARHPLLEKALKREKKEIVPLTITLTDQKRILMISGPNAGGKSVCLKTVGLLQYMFQWGMLVPVSESSEMMVFDRIMVDIGDDQSIDNDLSTYSSFLSNMKDILQQADDKTLVLIDEFGSGTEPAAGGAIAEAILAELDRRGTYGVITTHYTNLKLYASRGDTHVANGAMMFDVQNIAPLFRLEMGLPGNSFAFELARKMGLPENIVKDAEIRAGDEFVGIERNLRRIARNRKALDEKLEKIRNTDRTLESITDKYQKELLEIRKKKKEILDEATKEAQEIVAGANRKVENTIKTIKEAQAEKEITREARKELQDFVSALTQKKELEQKAKDDYIERKIRQIDARKERERQRKLQRADEKTRKEMEEQAEAQRKLEEFRNAPLKPGEKVRIKSNGMVGEIMKVSAKTVVVNIGNISSKLSPDKVERITSNEYRDAVKDSAPQTSRVVIDSSISARKLNFSPELDVRGERLNDALDKVTRYVDDAIMLGIPSVRIIHGKGTGVLREEIQKMLRTMSGVESVSDEHIQFGGTGVTIVSFY